VAIVLLADGYTLSSSNFGKIMPEGFGNMLDAIAAFGFATAMDVSGMNIVRIEQQRNFALANWVAATAEINPFVARVGNEQLLQADANTDPRAENRSWNAASRRLPLLGSRRSTNASSCDISGQC
jgi:hypothetical protein